MWTPTLSFFFYCYGDHRDLHSFPTRRSSDLSPDAAWRRGADRGQIATFHLRDHQTDLGRQRRGLARGDRKSTRLNSSHSSISYAVFCLKKKKHDILLLIFLHLIKLRDRLFFF